MSVEGAEILSPDKAPEQWMPFGVPRPDRILPIFIWGSLIVHLTIFLPSLLTRGTDKSAASPKEIPVEIVQLARKVAEAPKPIVKKPVASRPAAKAAPPPKPAQKAMKVAQKAPPKPVPRPAPKPAPKPAAQKPPTQSVAERLKQLLGPMPAIALPGSAVAGTEAVSYTQLVLSKLAKAKKEGRYQGVPGAASVAFTIGDSGDVVSVAIVRPSGDPSLDAEAIAMVKRGAPYPPPPPGGRRDYAITLRFQPLI